MLTSDTQCCAQRARWRYRCQQYGCRDAVGLKVFLYDQATHRMTNQYGRAIKLACDLLHIGDVIGDACPAQAFLTLAFAMPAQVEGVRGITMLREIGEKVFVPAPRAVPGSMHKQEWRRMSGLKVALRLLRIQFQVHLCCLSCYLLCAVPGRGLAPALVLFTDSPAHPMPASSAGRYCRGVLASP